MSNLINLQNIPLTKQAITAAGDNFAHELLDAGEQNPLDALIKLRALRDAIDCAIGQLETAAMDEAEQWGDDRSRFGVGFQVRSGTTRYDYGHDAAWSELKARETAVGNERKAREKFLKALDKEMVDPETGEIVEPARVTAVGKASLALSFPKE